MKDFSRISHSCIHEHLEQKSFSHTLTSDAEASEALSCHAVSSQRIILSNIFGSDESSCFSFLSRRFSTSAVKYFKISTKITVCYTRNSFCLFMQSNINANDCVMFFFGLEKKTESVKQISVTDFCLFVIFPKEVTVSMKKSRNLTRKWWSCHTNKKLFDTKKQESETQNELSSLFLSICFFSSLCNCLDITGHTLSWHQRPYVLVKCTEWLQLSIDLIFRLQFELRFKEMA